MPIYIYLNVPLLDFILEYKILGIGMGTWYLFWRSFSPSNRWGQKIVNKHLSSRPTTLFLYTYKKLEMKIPNWAVGEIMKSSGSSASWSSKYSQFVISCLNINSQWAEDNVNRSMSHLLHLILSLFQLRQ